MREASVIAAQELDKLCPPVALPLADHGSEHVHRAITAATAAKRTLEMLLSHEECHLCHAPLTADVDPLYSGFGECEDCYWARAAQMRAARRVAS